MPPKLRGPRRPHCDEMVAIPIDMQQVCWVVGAAETSWKFMVDLIRRTSTAPESRLARPTGSLLNRAPALERYVLLA